MHINPLEDFFIIWYKTIFLYPLIYVISRIYKQRWVVKTYVDSFVTIQEHHNSHMVGLWLQYDYTINRHRLSYTYYVVRTNALSQRDIIFFVAGIL